MRLFKFLLAGAAACAVAAAAGAASADEPIGKGLVMYMRPDFEAFDLSSFRMKLCTSAPFAAALKADILARWPGGLTEYYGMTEGGGTCILDAHLHPDKRSEEHT